MVRGGSRLGKLGGPNSWWDAIIFYGLQISFYLVYYLVLPIRTAQPILPTITTAFNFIDNGIVDYDQSIAGSLIVELSGWISCWQFCYAYISYLGWRFLMMSLSGSLAYFSNGYYQDITSPTICRTNRRKLQIFNSTYGYDPFVAVDQQYLYFAGLMLSCTVSYLFSCNAKWQVYM